MIIAIASQNGGSAKAGLANHLALHCSRNGRKVLLLDTRAVTGRSLPDHLESLRLRYKDIVIDVGIDGQDTLESRAGLIAARLVVVPVTPDQLDQASQDQLTTRLNTARMFNPGLRVLYAAIGNASDPTPTEMEALYHEVFAH